MKRLILIALALFISACAASEIENNAEAYFNRGVDWHKKGDYNQAIANCSKAIEINPRYAEAYNNRGSAYLDLAQFDHGCQDLQKACELGLCKGLAWARRETLCQ